MTKPESLLAKALEHKPGRKNRLDYTEQHAELAVAWLTNEISVSQVAMALGKNVSGTVYVWLCQSLRVAYRLGMLHAAERKHL